MTRPVGPPMCQAHTVTDDKKWCNHRGTWVIRPTCPCCADKQAWALCGNHLVVGLRWVRLNAGTHDNNFRVTDVS